MSLTCQVRIVLSIPRRRADAVRRALEPDNVGFPEGLSMAMEDAGDGLVLDFEGSGVTSLVGTIDEVLEHVQMVLRVTE